MDSMNKKKVKKEVDDLVDASENDIDEVEKILKKNEQYLALLKAEVEGRIGRKNGWTAFSGVIPMFLSIIALLISVMGIYDLRIVGIILFDVIGICIGVPILLIGIIIYLYIGDQGSIYRILSLIESYERNGYLVKPTTEKANITNNVVNNDEILSISIQHDTCSFNIEIIQRCKER